jgi:hypothetical protein
MNCYEEKERRNAMMWPYMEKVVVAIVITFVCAAGLSWCAPAMVSEKEYQDRRLREALNGEAKFRAHQFLKEGTK